MRRFLNGCGLALILGACCILNAGCKHNFIPENELVELSIRLSIENLAGGARTAVPSSTVAADAYDCWTLVAKSKSNSSANPITLEWQSEQGVYNGTISTGEWEISAEGYTDSTKSTQIFYGSTTLTVMNGGEYSAVVPVKYLSSGTGNLDLEIEFATTSYQSTPKIEVSGFGMDELDTTYTLSNDKLSLKKDNVNSGTYSVLIKVYETDGAFIFAIRQTVNIRDNVTTDTWVSSGEPYFAEDGKFVITDDTIGLLTSTQVYVKGQGGTLKADASDSNSGSWASPLASLNAAFNKVYVLNTLNPGEVEYTIFVDGTIYGAQETEYESDQPLKVSICGFNGKTDTDGFDGKNKDNSTSAIFMNFEDESTGKSQITVSNLSFSNIVSYYNGPAIRIYNGKLVLNDCNFKNNSTSEVSGGAVFIDGELSATNCLFKGNHVELGGLGGAIYACNEKGTTVFDYLDKCVFEDNYVEDTENTSPDDYISNLCGHGSGGAVYAEGVHAIITSCTFTGNHASHAGGAFAANASGKMLSFMDTTFSRNYISQPQDEEHMVCGGAIASKAGNISLSGKIVAADNYITRINPDTEESEEYPSNLYLKKLGYLGIAKDFSGESQVGISLQEPLTESNNYKSKEITSGFYSCDAAKENRLDVFRSDFEGVVGWSDSEEGSSDYHRELSIAIANSNGVSFKVYDNLTFSFNRENINMEPGSTEEEKTLVITPMLDGKPLTESQKNKFTSFQLKVYSRGKDTGFGKSGTSSEEMVLFFDDTKAYWGEDYYWIYINAVYDGVTYGLQKGIKFGRSLVVSNADDLSDLLLSGEGGEVSLGFSSYTGGDLQSIDLQIPDFSQTDKALFVITKGSYEIDGCDATITGTSSDNRVFAIGGSDTSVVIENLNIKSSGSRGSKNTKGKAILVDCGATVTLRNCTVSDFKGKGEGIIHVINGTLILENCTLSSGDLYSNASWGGVVRVDANGKCIIRDSIITGNKGEHLGAGLYSEGELYVYNSTISGNTAQRAAGIYAAGKVLYMEGVTVSENKAVNGGYYANAGGGLWVTAKEATLVDCTFQGNTCGSASSHDSQHSGGAAIYVEATTLTIRDCKIIDNESKKNGGAIQLYAESTATTKPKVILEGTNTITGNTASAEGNIMYVSSELGATYNGTDYSKGQCIN